MWMDCDSTPVVNLHGIHQAFSSILGPSHKTWMASQSEGFQAKSCEISCMVDIQLDDFQMRNDCIPADIFLVHLYWSWPDGNLVPNTVPYLQIVYIIICIIYTIYNIYNITQSSTRAGDLELSHWSPYQPRPPPASTARRPRPLASRSLHLSLTC